MLQRSVRSLLEYFLTRFKGVASAPCPYQMVRFGRAGYEAVSCVQTLPNPHLHQAGTLEVGSLHHGPVRVSGHMHGVSYSVCVFAPVRRDGQNMTLVHSINTELLIIYQVPSTRVTPEVQQGTPGPCCFHSRSQAPNRRTELTSPALEWPEV